MDLSSTQTGCHCSHVCDNTTTANLYVVFLKVNVNKDLWCPLIQDMLLIICWNAKWIYSTINLSFYLNCSFNNHILEENVGFIGALIILNLKMQNKNSWTWWSLSVQRRNDEIFPPDCLFRVTVTALQSDWATLLEGLLFDFMHLMYNRNDTHTFQQSAEFPRQKLFFCFHFQSHSAPTLNNNYELTVPGVRTRVCVSPDVWYI